MAYSAEISSEAGVAQSRRASRGDGGEGLIRVADVPKTMTVFHHLTKTHDYAAACARVAPRTSADGLIAVPLPRALVSGLRKAAQKAIARHGLHAWLSKEGRPKNSSYESLSLTYNPESHDPGIRDVHQATLGTSVNPASEFFYGKVHRFAEIKNTYFDTYGFRLLTPAAKTGALGRLLSECNLSLVRSRLSVLYGDDEADINDPEFGWHRDEPVFENLRVNIPLVSHPSYRLQIEHASDTPVVNSPTATTHYLKSGFAYTFDTNRPHRVYPVRMCRIMRVHLVLGFSPWFRYVPSLDGWVPNEYYGRKHPFDILREGGLHPSMKIVQDRERYA